VVVLWGKEEEEERGKRRKENGREKRGSFTNVSLPSNATSSLAVSNPHLSRIMHFLPPKARV